WPANGTLGSRAHQRHLPHQLDVAQAIRRRWRFWLSVVNARVVAGAGNNLTKRGFVRVGGEPVPVRSPAHRRTRTAPDHPCRRADFCLRPMESVEELVDWAAGSHASTCLDALVP